MRCLGRLGCLLVLVIVACIAWLTRSHWLPLVGGHPRPEPVATSDVWQALTPAGAARAREALARLSRPAGPVFENIAGADAASYMYQALAHELPRSADSVRAAIINDQLCLRASVTVADLGGPAVLGPLASMLGDRNRLQFCGVFHVIHPGLSEYVVRELRIRDIALPPGVIPRVLQHIERGSRPVGTSPDGLPFLTPAYIADIRIANGKVTVYKNG